MKRKTSRKPRKAAKVSFHRAVGGTLVIRVASVADPDPPKRPGRTGVGDPDPKKPPGTVIGRATVGDPDPRKPPPPSATVAWKFYPALRTLMKTAEKKKKIKISVRKKGRNRYETFTIKLAGKAK